jgi:hypothetical protein
MTSKRPIMPILLSIVLALGLWGYVSMTSLTTVYVTYPLVVDLPEERSLEIEPPNSISVKLRTSVKNAGSILQKQTYLPMAL